MSLDQADTRQAAIASAPDVLALLDASMEAVGFAGEQRNARVLYLVLTSRLLSRPVSVAIKGPSSGGKSFLVERVLAHFPAEATLRLTGMTEKSLVYMGEDIAHRHIVLSEAVGAVGRMRNYFIRTLLSEGHISWTTVERSKDGRVGRMIVKKGPTGLIMTTTSLRDETEIESRLMTLNANDTREQTRRVMQATAKGQGGIGANGLGLHGPKVDPAWPAFQTALGSGERRVVIPYAGVLADECANAAVRMRRDFSCVLTLIEAHALLHRETRGRDDDGRIVATTADYDAVRNHVVDILSEGLKSSVPKHIRRTVAAVQHLSGLENSGVKDVARLLQIDPSAASRRCQAAIRAGYVVDRKSKFTRKSYLVVGEQMPKDVYVLPESLERASSVQPNENDQKPAESPENAAA